MKKERQTPVETTKVETSLRMRSTAALQQEVSEELNEEDKPLKELLADDENENQE